MSIVFNSPYFLVPPRIVIVSIALVNMDMLPIFSLSLLSSFLCLLLAFLIMIYSVSDKSHCSNLWQNQGTSQNSLPSSLMNKLIISHIY